MVKRGACFQGGGCKGAFSAGEIVGLIEERGYTWDEYYGTSVGALVATVASTEDVELITRAFTTMSDKDVWSKNPIKSNTAFIITNLLWKMLRKKPALGETKNLRKTLEKLYTEEEYETTMKRIIACSVNYSDGKVSYGRSDKLPYKEFLDFVHASTSVPLLCSPVNVFGDMFQDGGLLMNTPIEQAIKNGCNEIDVFMLNTKPSSEAIVEVLEKNNNGQKWSGKTLIDYAGRSVTLMQEHISTYNMIMAQEFANKHDVKIRFRYPEFPLVDNAIDVMKFDKKKMTEMFDYGYNSIMHRGASVKITKKG